MKARELELRDIGRGGYDVTDGPAPLPSLPKPDTPSPWFLQRIPTILEPLYQAFRIAIIDCTLMFFWGSHQLWSPMDIAILRVEAQLNPFVFLYFWPSSKKNFKIYNKIHEKIKTRHAWGFVSRMYTIVLPVMIIFRRWGRSCHLWGPKKQCINWVLCFRQNSSTSSRASLGLVRTGLGSILRTGTLKNEPIAKRSINFRKYLRFMPVPVNSWK